jgi:hypothetical protein
LYPSLDDGGQPITDYDLEIDGGSLTSNFTPVVGYNYSTNGFTATIDATADSLTAGLYYRFQIRSLNSMGYSPYSDIVLIGLGPLPSAPI